MLRHIRLVLVIFPLLLASCSTRFHRDWKNALLSKPLPAGSIQGPWEGAWFSETTGHTGKLRCIVGPEKNKDGDRSFTYRANWARILSGAFRADHRVKPQGSGFTFEGQQVLAEWAGGKYTYQGAIQNGEFKATYRCAKDRGTFEMRRPAP